MSLAELPITPYLETICRTLKESPSRFLVLTAETAAGKSTAVPPALLDAFPKKIVMLEPRRLAVLSIASRIAELLGEKGKKYGLTSIDMSMMILDDSENLIKASDIIMAKVGRELDFEDVKKVRELASAIIIRSARLVASSFVALVWQRAGSGKIEKQHVAVDGSVYEKMPLAKENIIKAMGELLGEDAAQVDTILDNGGSGLGAAIAAAMVKSN